MIKHRQNIIAASVSIIISLLLAIIKGVVFLLSGSLAVLASAVDSLFDSGLSFVNLLIIRAASQPPDADHSFGHGKFEAFSQLIEAVVIGSFGIYIAYESVLRLFDPQELTNDFLAVMIMGVSLVVTTLLVLFLRSVAKKTGSLVLEADMMHFSSDLLANAAVLLGLIIVSFTGLSWIDPILSLFVAFLILQAASQLLGKSFAILTDKEIAKPLRQEIVSILNEAKEEKEIASWHLLRTRQVGSQIHVDAHLVFHPQENLQVAHDLADEIMHRIQEKLPGVYVLFHLDPHDDSRENIRQMKKILS